MVAAMFRKTGDSADKAHIQRVGQLDQIIAVRQGFGRNGVDTEILQRFENPGCLSTIPGFPHHGENKSANRS